MVVHIAGEKETNAQQEDKKREEEQVSDESAIDDLAISIRDTRQKAEQTGMMNKNLLESDTRIPVIRRSEMKWTTSCYTYIHRKTIQQKKKLNILKYIFYTKCRKISSFL